MKNNSSLGLLYNLFILLATPFIVPTHAQIDYITAPETLLHRGDIFNVTFHASNRTQFLVLFGLASSPEIGKSIPWVPAIVPGPCEAEWYIANLTSDVTLGLPYNLANHTTSYTLQAVVAELVSKKKLASSMFQSSILSDLWLIISFSFHGRDAQPGSAFRFFNTTVVVGK